MASPLSGYVAVSQIVDTAGPGQPFYAPASGGGGGGGVGPNPVFSTVTTQLDANFGGSVSASGLTLNSALGSPSILTPSANGVLNISNGANCPFITNCGSLTNGSSAVTVSSINVSSVNGQPVGGGGGGGGPNLTLSSLTVSSLITSGLGLDVALPGHINMIISQNVPGPDTDLFWRLSTTSAIPGYNDSAGLQQGDSIPAIAGITTLVYDGGSISDAWGAVAVGSVYLPGAISTGTTLTRTAFLTGDAQGNLFLDALNTNISSLTVSSINGAQPGGGSGGPPPAVVSTISSLVNVSTINSGSPGILNVLGGMVVSDNIGTGSISTLRIDSIAPGGSVSIPLTILSTVSGDVNISTLTVSSVNGAPYPPASGGSVFSSINIPGGPGSAFNADPNVVTQILSIPLIPNHVYSVDVNARVIANNAPNVSATDNYYLELVANGGATQALNTAWGVQVSTLTSGSIYTEVGGTAIFKAPANPVSTLLLNVLGTFSTTTRVDSFSYIDFGAI